MNSLFFSLIHYELISFLRIHYESTTFLANHYVITIFFVNSLRFHYFFRKFTMNPLFFAISLFFHYLFYANSLCIHYNFFFYQIGCIGYYKLYPGSMAFSSLCYFNFIELHYVIGGITHMSHKIELKKF